MPVFQIGISVLKFQLFSSEAQGESSRKPTAPTQQRSYWKSETLKRAGVTQLVECQPSKLNVASSRLVSRSNFLSS